MGGFPGSPNFRQTHTNKLIASHDDFVCISIMQQMQSSGSSMRQLKQVQIKLWKRSSNQSSPAKDRVMFHLPASSLLLSKINRAAISDSVWQEIFPGFLGTLHARSGRLNRGMCFDFDTRCSSGLAKDATSGGSDCGSEQEHLRNKIVYLRRHGKCQAVCHDPGRSTRVFLRISTTKSSKIRFS